MKLALMVLLGLIPEAKFTYTDVYNFPMLGVFVFHKPATFRNDEEWVAYGSVTIVHRKLALVASDNIFQQAPAGLDSDFITNSKFRKSLYVFVATDLLSPPDWYENDKVQKIQVKDGFLSKSSDWLGQVDERALGNIGQLAKEKEKSLTILSELPDFQDPEKDLSKDGWKFNPFHDPQWDVGILLLDRELRWTPYALPSPNFFWDAKSLIQDYKTTWDAVEGLERSPHTFTPCSMPGWSPMGNNEIIYHRVVYVRFKECAEAICGAYPSTCLRYLNIRHHICFKSVSFADSCFFDQGAPVLCDWFENKVLGVLTKTFECGSETLPSVVTRMDAIKAFAGLGVPELYANKNEPKLDDEHYTVDPNI